MLSMRQPNPIKLVAFFPTAAQHTEVTVTFQTASLHIQYELNSSAAVFQPAGEPQSSA